MDNILVMKFGGSSLADRQKIENVANIVISKAKTNKIVVVVSAMGKTTDGLIAEAAPFNPEVNLREMDMLLTSGERISAALVAMALNAKGAKALSLTGSQAGIITDDNHTNARIIEVRPYRVMKALEENKIVVVSGFQGVSFNKEVTTLGRGGSDISAVALASALDAKRCEIYSDVVGVYAADPRIIENPAFIEALSYQEMQELAEAGAKVLHPKAVEFGKIKDTIIHCKGTFQPEHDGTVISNLEGRIKPRIVGIATEEKVVLVHTYEENASELDTVGRIMEFSHGKNLKIKQIAFHRSHGSGMVGSFIIPEKENYHLEQVLSEMKGIFKSTVDIYHNYSAVSLVGAGITDRHDFLLESIGILRDNNIPAGSFHTSSFRISMLVERKLLEKTTKLFYGKFIG